MALIAANFSYWRIALLGSGFMSIMLCWSLFNSYVPIFLRNFVESSTLVGFIMSLDNLAGMTLAPWFAAMSDRTSTRIGRRMPFLVVGMPLAAAAIPLLPAAGSLGVLVLAIVLFDLAMSLFRAPTVALMPDLTPISHRSQANGVINLMGGVGALAAFFVGAALYRQNPAYPFWGAAGVLLFVLVLLLVVIREPRQAEASESDGAGGERGGILAAVRRLPRGSPSFLWTLIAFFFASLAYSSIETFFTTYSLVVLGWHESLGATVIGFFALAFIVCSLPAGGIGARVGQEKAMSWALAGLIAITATAPLYRSPVAVGAALALAGCVWALMGVNIYPHIVRLGSEKSIGTSTGLYYFFSSLASSSGPPVVGAVMDVFGEVSMFGFSAVAFTISLLCLRRAGRVAGGARGAQAGGAAA